MIGNLRNHLSKVQTEEVEKKQTLALVLTKLNCPRPLLNFQWLENRQFHMVQRCLDLELTKMKTLRMPSNLINRYASVLKQGSKMKDQLRSLYLAQGHIQNLYFLINVAGQCVLKKDLVQVNLILRECLDLVAINKEAPFLILVAQLAMQSVLYMLQVEHQDQDSIRYPRGSAKFTDSLFTYSKLLV